MNSEPRFTDSDLDAAGACAEARACFAELADESGNVRPPEDWGRLHYLMLSAKYPIVAKWAVQTRVVQVPSFAGADLGGLSLRGFYLRSADFSGANLDECDLSGADLRGANLIGASMVGTTLEDAAMHGAVFHGCALDALWETPAGRRFAAAMLTEQQCEPADLAWSTSDFIRMAAECPELTHDLVPRGVVPMPDFAGADLAGANMAGAYFRGANFAGADLTGANLSRCDLRGCCLDGTSTQGCSFDGARL